MFCCVFSKFLSNLSSIFPLFKYRMMKSLMMQHMHLMAVIFHVFCLQVRNQCSICITWLHVTAPKLINCLIHDWSWLLLIILDWKTFSDSNGAVVESIFNKAGSPKYKYYYSDASLVVDSMHDAIKHFKL